MSHLGPDEFSQFGVMANSDTMRRKREVSLGGNKIEQITTRDQKLAFTALEDRKNSSIGIIIHLTISS